MRRSTRAGVSPTDVTDVVVGIGPGPFTGLRVGIVTGRTFAFALGLPVRGLTSLDALAHEAWLGGRRGDLLVATDARRKEVYAAAYLLDDGAATRVAGPVVSRAAELHADLRAMPSAGRGAVLYPDSLADAARSARRQRRCARGPGRAEAGGGTRRAGRHTAAGGPRSRVRRAGAALSPPPRRRARTAQHEVDAGVSDVTLRELEWTDLTTLAALERELFADDAWSEQTWWAELAGRPRRDYVVADAERHHRRVCRPRRLGRRGRRHDGGHRTGSPASRGSGACCSTTSCVGPPGSGCEALLLEVRADNDAARNLYERNGFEVISVRRRYYQPGDVDALVMRRLLTDGDR